MLFDVIRQLSAGYQVDLWQVLAQVLSVVFVILCILPLHEFAHGWVAYKLGDPTAKLAGRLTLNPLASVDPMGAAAILLLALAGPSPCLWTADILRSPNRAWPWWPWPGPGPTCWPPCWGRWSWR